MNYELLGQMFCGWGFYTIGTLIAHFSFKKELDETISTIIDTFMMGIVLYIWVEPLVK